MALIIVLAISGKSLEGLPVALDSKGFFGRAVLRRGFFSSCPVTASNSYNAAVALVSSPAAQLIRAYLYSVTANLDFWFEGVHP